MKSALTRLVNRQNYNNLVSIKNQIKINMRTTFQIALAMAATASAKVQTHYLENDWQVQFDPDTCDLKVDKIVYGQSTSHVTVFEADKHMLSVGKGTVDSYKVMTAGNIKQFPERSS